MKRITISLKREDAQPRGDEGCFRGTVEDLHIGEERKALEEEVWTEMQPHIIR